MASLLLVASALRCLNHLLPGFAMLFIFPGTFSVLTYCIPNPAYFLSFGYKYLPSLLHNIR